MWLTGVSVCVYVSVYGNITWIVRIFPESESSIQEIRVIGVSDVSGLGGCLLAKVNCEMIIML